VVVLFELALDVEVRVAAEVVVDPVQASEHFPRAVEDQLLDALGQFAERQRNILSILRVKERIHVSVQEL